jgi:hypothetical protein
MDIGSVSIGAVVVVGLGVAVKMLFFSKKDVAVAVAVPSRGVAAKAAPTSVNGSSLTPQGTPGNSLSGYISLDGGKFGGWSDSLNPSEVLRGLDSVTGIDSGTTYIDGVFGGGDATKYGMSTTASVSEIGAVAKQVGLIANRVPSAIVDGLKSENWFIKKIAQQAAEEHPELLLDGAVSPIAGNWTR